MKINSIRIDERAKKIIFERIILHKTLSDIGKSCGISKERVRQILYTSRKILCHHKSSDTDKSIGMQILDFKNRAITP